MARSSAFRVPAAVVMSVLLSCVSLSGESCTDNPDPSPVTEHSCSSDDHCLDGYACIQGYCTALDEESLADPCSPEQPLGTCPQENTQCIDSACQVPCASSSPNDACDDGLRCIDGTCTPICSDSDPDGFCPVAGQICDRGECIDPEDSPRCSPQNLSGSCTDGQSCSKMGDCIPHGTCSVKEDCPGELVYCTANNLCRPDGACAVDIDCQEALGIGQGFICVDDGCVERTTCTVDEDCIPDKFCGVAGNCLTRPNCDGDEDCVDGSKCSGVGECIPKSECRVQDDCAGVNTTCRVSNTCLADFECKVVDDCPPVHACTDNWCTLRDDAERCDTNERVTSGCADNEFSCCPPGATCCTRWNYRCSAVSHCIPDGTCVDDTDCLQPQFYCSDDFICEPTRWCDTCTEDEHCEFVYDARNTPLGGCVPNDRCITHSGCFGGYRCTPERRCEISPQCGLYTLDIGNPIAPNVLVVLDRSSSANLCGSGDALDGPCGFNDGPCSVSTDCDQASGMECHNLTNGDNTGICIDVDCTAGRDGSTTTRWSEALDAIETLTEDYDGRVNFGLSFYPRSSGSDACSADCNWMKCGPRSLAAGVIDVEVGIATRPDILIKLQETVPGGATPTAPTLRSILAREDRGGLDSDDRANAVLLITDGEATAGDPDPVIDGMEIMSCMPPCSDGIHNGSESDTDCGGLCPPCSVGYGCDSRDDCETQLCRGGFCRAKTCANDVLDDTEVAVDCGGDCGTCPEGAPCTVADPDLCSSGVCITGVCATSLCDDGVKNASETDVDCGGRCPGCVDGKPCVFSTDCQSGVCQNRICRPSGCGDGDPSAGETDTDCGGPACGPCANDKACSANSDCLSGMCNAGACELPLCQNGIHDPDPVNDETDVDCGGANCEPCAGARHCEVNDDCISKDCRDCADNAETEQACRVDTAIRQLYASDPRIKTFVVGFAFQETSANLNCHAANGRTSRNDVTGCKGLIDARCASATAACYYEASDKASLSAAFADIMDRVSACDYAFPPPGASPVYGGNRLFFYLVDKTTVPLTSTRIHQDIDWRYYPNRQQIRVFGAACEKLKFGVASALIVNGCLEGE